MAETQDNTQQDATLTPAPRKNNFFRIGVGVVMLLLLALVAAYFLFPSLRGEKKEVAPATKVVTPAKHKAQTPAWKKVTDAQQKEIDDLKGRVDKHAEAISDLANAQLGNEDSQPVVQEPKKEVEKTSKLKKYTSKGWDYKDFPENW